MLRRICGEGLCGRIAGLLVGSGFVVALAFDGLVAIAGGGLIMAGGVLLAMALEGSVAQSPALAQPTLHPSSNEPAPSATAQRRA